MDVHHFDEAGRSMRWYEWLLGLVLLFAACGAHGGTLVRCIAADGAVTFTDQGCPAGLTLASITHVVPPPPAAASPQWLPTPTPARVARAARTETDSPRIGKHAPARSFECRSSDGQVFYRHGACPRTVDARGTRIGGGASGKRVAVQGLAISRDEACAQMRRAGAAWRVGRDHDEDVSSYDKNVGRDPCA